MEKTPFMWFKDHLDEMKFVGPPGYSKTVSDATITKYKEVFSRVLEKMDKYFVQNKLYDQIDMQEILQDMVYSPNLPLVFDINDEPSKLGIGADAFFANYNAKYKTRSITVDTYALGKNSFMESLLCHEFIHALTMSPSIRKYKKDGKLYESRAFFYQGNELNVANDTPRWLGNLLNEGLTEALTADIMGENHAYLQNVALIRYIQTIIGNKNSTVDFLRGDFSSLLNFFGPKHLKQFVDEINAIDFRQASIENTHYIIAQKMILEKSMMNIKNDPNATLENSIDKLTTVLSGAPSMESSRVRSALLDGWKSDCVNFLIKNFKYDKLANKDELSNLIEQSFDMKLKIKNSEYDIPNAKSGFSIKKSKDGIKLMYNNNEFRLSKCYAQYGDGQKVDIDKLADGKYKVSAINKDNSIVEMMGLKVDNNNPDNLTVFIKGKESKMNLAALNKARERELTQNLSLLKNVNYLDQVKRVYNNNRELNISTIRKIKDNEGKEYLIVTSAGGNAVFYELVGLGVTKKIDVVKQKKGESLTVINGNNFKGMTDDVTMTYNLSNGKTFVKYIDKNGLEVYGKKLEMSPSNTAVKELDNQVLYSQGNRSMTNIFKANKPTSTSNTTTDAPRAGYEQKRYHQDNEEKKQNEDAIKKKEEPNITWGRGR